MDLVPVLSTVILVATIATMILAVFSYAAFKLRDSRKPEGPEEKPEGKKAEETSFLGPDDTDIQTM